LYKKVIKLSVSLLYTKVVLKPDKLAFKKKNNSSWYSIGGFPKSAAAEGVVNHKTK